MNNICSSERLLILPERDSLAVPQTASGYEPVD